MIAATNRHKVTFTEAEQAEVSTLTLTKRIAKVWATRGALTTRELSEMLSISGKTIYKMAKSGLIPCYRIRGSVRFDGKQIIDWLRQQRNS